MVPHYLTLADLLAMVAHKRASEKIGATADGTCPTGVNCTFNWDGWRWAVYNDCHVGRLRTLHRSIEREGHARVVVTATGRRRLGVVSEVGTPARGLNVWRLGPAQPVGYLVPA